MKLVSVKEAVFIDSGWDIHEKPGSLDEFYLVRQESSAECSAIAHSESLPSKKEIEELKTDNIQNLVDEEHRYIDVVHPEKMEDPVNISGWFPDMHFILCM